MLGDIVEEFTLDAERPAGELDLHLAVFVDVLDAIPEEMCDMGGIGGCSDGDDRPTPMPLAASAVAIRFAASTSLPQVKQCANSA
jgi:hypothetical protein